MREARRNIRHVHAREEHGRETDDRTLRPHPSAVDSPTTRLLDLQQTSGNAAVTRLVQRSASDRGAVARKPKPAHAGAGGATGGAHKSAGLSLGESSFDRAALIGHAGDAFNAGDYAHAAALLERAYELSPSRDIALNIYRCYQKLGDQKQAEHWLAVHHGEGEAHHGEGEAGPPVAYQQF